MSKLAQIRAQLAQATAEQTSEFRKAMEAVISMTEEILAEKDLHRPNTVQWAKKVQDQLVAATQGLDVIDIRSRKRAA
jgi:hypothetical protein